MIDLTLEEPITFREATKLRCLHRNGRPPHIATLYRWSDRGIRGIKLDIVQVGGSRCTSIAAVHRWIAHLTRGDSTVTQSESQRQHAIETASKELTEAGI